MVSTLSRITTLVFSVIVLSQQPAFTGTDLSRNKAEELLQKVNADWLSKWCRLAPSLIGKPEFAPLKSESWCSMKITVSGIRTTSPTEAIVEWAAVAVGEVNKSLIKQWLEAMNKLQGRLKNLPSEKYCRAPLLLGGCLGWEYKFKDPSDGSIFAAEEVEDIRQTPEWKQFETWQREQSDLLAKGSPRSATYNATFQLWDDGWRIIKTH